MAEKEPKPDSKPDVTEESLVKEYTNLTGASETDARCVLMHLPEKEEEDAKDKKSQGDKPPA